MYLLSLYSVKVQGQALGHGWVEDIIVTHCPYSGSLGTHLLPRDSCRKQLLCFFSARNLSLADRVWGQVKVSPEEALNQ